MSSIKLTADSGGGPLKLKAPASSSNTNINFILPKMTALQVQALVTDAKVVNSFALKES